MELDALEDRYGQETDPAKKKETGAKIRFLKKEISRLNDVLNYQQ